MFKKNFYCIILVVIVLHLSLFLGCDDGYPELGSTKGEPQIFTTGINELHVEIGLIIISNKSSENITVSIPYAGIDRSDLMTNKSLSIDFDGITIGNPLSRKENIENIYNNLKEFFNKKELFQPNNLYFESNQVNFKITNLNVLIENSHFITNNNFEEMKKYLNTQGVYRIYEYCYPGRFLLVILTIDDSTLTNTYWGTTNE